MYVHDCWLPGGPWNDAWALHSKDPVGQSLPRLGLPPIHSEYGLLRTVEKCGTLREKKKMPLCTSAVAGSSGLVKSRGSTVSSFEKILYRWSNVPLVRVIVKIV